MDIARKTDAEQQVFVERVLECARDAERTAGRIEYTLDVAGTRVRLCFAGQRLVRELLPALLHLVLPTEADDRAPDAVFHLWDSRTTGIAMPPPPCGEAQFTDRGDIWGFGGGRFRVAFHWIECSVNVFDSATRTAAFWVESADHLPFWSKASPLRTLFHWWMELNDRQLLHAAAFGTEDRGLLLTGPGGGGKSTTALAALAEGLHYIGDDYVVVALEPVPTAFSLYNTAKLNADQLHRFPQLSPLVERSYGVEKAVMRMFPDWRNHLAHSVPLVALMTPRITGVPETTAVPADRHTLRTAAAFTTMSQLPYAGDDTYGFIDRLTSVLPCFELRLGSDLDAVGASIRAFLDRGDAMNQSSAPHRPAADAAGPLISVIVPVYNGARFLREAVDNILAEAYPALEIIVVDDGSTDDIASVVASLPVPVRYFRQENAGPAASRNRGIRDAAGEFIAFLDVDDLWASHSLGRRAAALRSNPALDVVHGHAQLMATQDADRGYECVGNPSEAFPFYIGAGLYRRSAFERVGLFDPNLRFGEDHDWFLRATEAGLAIERLMEVTLLVRRHGRNMTHGKSLVELNALRVFKMALDRKRLQVTES